MANKKPRSSVERGLSHVQRAPSSAAFDFDPDPPAIPTALAPLAAFRHLHLSHADDHRVRQALRHGNIALIKIERAV